MSQPVDQSQERMKFQTENKLTGSIRRGILKNIGTWTIQVLADAAN
jgi:hypothetical protein